METQGQCATATESNIATQAMDQNDFRKILTNAPSIARTSLSSSGWGLSRPKRTASSSAPAFKPRNINDKAPKPSVLALTEKQRVADVDQYEKLGTAKGLDYTILEQERAKKAALDSVQDDELLENAIRESTSMSNPPIAQPTKKRTRQEIVEELKQKRARGDDKEPDPEKPQSRFKPIGAPKDGKPKKKKLVEKAGKSKTMQSDPSPQSVSAPPKELPSEQASDEDEDIFAGAGEYEGVDFDEEEEEKLRAADAKTEAEKEAKKKNWFEEPLPENGEEEEGQIEEAKAPKSTSPPPPPTHPDPEESSVQQEKLAPLASSKIRSISDFLAVDKDLEAEDKRKAKRDKRKGRRQT